ncbi:MAG: hypothetical protein K9J13_05610 [Saprospiraceae bacterium]|nr:hypothetical protein [Saprospiraceae bacterium]
MLFYIAILIFAFYKISLWDSSLIKNTIYWTFGCAFIMFFNIDKALNNERHFRKIFKDCFKLIIIIEFLSTLYSFHLAIEFLSIPIILFIGVMIAFSEYKEVDNRVIKFFNLLSVLYALAVIIFSIVSISGNLEVVFTIENLKSILFGSVMTLLLIPFLYFVALFMVYESFFNMQKFILKDKPKLFKFLKWRIIKRCNFRLKKIRLVNEKLHIYTSITKKQIKADLNSILGNNE